MWLILYKYHLSLTFYLTELFAETVILCLHDTTGCRTRCQTGFQTRLTTGVRTGCIVYTAGCQTGCTTWFGNRLNEQWLFVQPVVKAVAKVVSCKRGLT